MKYDFDREIDRRGTSSVKWEFIQREDDPTQVVHTDQFFGEDRVLPLWVADMDFRCPQPVIDALVARAQQGIFGYTYKTDSYFEAVAGWMNRRHGWAIQPEWISITPGVVPALCQLVRTLIQPGQKVLVQTPVYYPFYLAIEGNGAEVVRNPLVYRAGRYQMDFDDLEAKTADPQVKAAILCSPHNPVGRVWTEEELTRFGEICLKNDVLVISDEIHADLILRGYHFTPFAAISEEFARRSITCMAASKTFNLAGLHVSNIIIPDAELHARFEQTLHSSGLFGVGVFGQVALEAAYNHGEEWLEQLLDYLTGNFQFMQDYLAQNITQIEAVPLEGTNLAWLDCRRLEMTGEELRQLMIKQARVYLDEGYIFGPEGEGFERINIACPRSVLSEALGRIKRAVETRNRV